MIIEKLFRHFWYKVSAFFLAILIWGLVQGEEIVEYNQRIRVNLHTTEGYGIRGSSIRYVEAQLRGPRVLVGERGLDVLEVSIDIPEQEEGEVEVIVDPDLIQGLDPRVRLQIRNPYIKLYVDRLVVKQLPVRVNLVGAPNEGFYVEKLSVSPPRIEVQGIRRDLLDVEELITEPIDITNLDQTKRFVTQVAPLSFLGPNAIKTKDVEVTVQVGDSKINQTFENVEIEVVAKAPNSRLSPQRVTLIVQATPAVLDNIKKEDLKAFIDVADLGVGRHDVEVKVKIPPLTVLVEVRPRRVLYEVSDPRKD